MRPVAAVFLAAAALGLPACGAQESDSAERFQGAEAEVADVVDELRSAGQSKNAERICSDILAGALVDELGSGGSDCVAEMTKAIGDADEFDLEVRDVTVTGNQARARVRGYRDRETTLSFARERDGWRATSLAG